MSVFRPVIIFFQKHPIEEILAFIFSVQFGSMLLLTAQQTGMPFLVRAANRSPFLPTTSVFMMEVLKIIFCWLVIWYNSASCSSSAKNLYSSVWGNKVETMKVAVPAVVYALQNNLYYIALANIDPTTYSVTYQLRILTTAVLAVCLLNKHLTMEQWGALLLSLAGVVFVQVDGSNSNTGASRGNHVVGVVSTLGMCWTSAFAGVYFEKMLKLSTADVWVQNIRLSILTLSFAAATMFASDFDKIQKDGMFQGWTALVWLVTALNSVGGLCVSIVMKYADNVKKTYCQSIAIGLTAVVSIALGERNITAMLIEGVTMVIISVFIYAYYPPQATKTPTLIEKESLLDNEDTAEDV